MLELRHLTKSYRTAHGRRYVFRDLNFHFPDGVNIGLIGRNGAGKSTLMRLLGGIDTPDSGSVHTDARISWPVGLAGGFQGSLSARDNVRFVCHVHGAQGEALRRRVRFVEKFADIGEYFDLPLKSYSSGMRSRVAFGLSMAFNFDYYLIDEVMAVGDAEFRVKCKAMFRHRLRKSNMILVSHNMNDIKEYCDVVVLLERGTATLYEDVRAGISAYQGKANVEAS
ncbi:ABC transporter ATP-binding protein [uncultured Azohydromonas sp.]|jgi:ABC-type polysaccharide/polyol phosphate transport system, ATPase component|uniref:ABC transporter ATP-binding protein n=1 Tax=uncultured Azohydromonas sp. TaxID=487342 RepID=UPI002618311E|nr:ABC transporter ATP-binding protein [uncultured Azohydromonas sp.]